MNRNRFAPALETLDGRIAPSVTPLANPVGMSTVAPTTHHHTLSGHGTGTYQNSHVNTGAGKTFQLTGNATFTETGKATVKGTLHSVGNIKQGHATGELTFTNKHGTVTIKLTGPLQKSDAALPSKFTYQVEKATGSYKSLKGTGNLSVTLTAAKTTSHQPSTHGTFKFSIS